VNTPAQPSLGSQVDIADASSRPYKGLGSYSDALNKPYKGLDSFQVEDTDLFFGREREAGELTTHILSSRFALIHAQSGAGKTSLLNARIVPSLERSGWIPVLIRPQNDPILATRRTTLDYVLPPVDLEIRAFDRALKSLGISPEASIADLLKQYDQLLVRDERLRALIQPFAPDDRSEADGEEGVGMITPYVCRLLRSTIDVSEFSEHLSALLGRSESRAPDGPLIDADTQVRDLAALLESDDLSRGYQSLQELLDIPMPGLWPFFENLIQVYGARNRHLALVLMFDQFEELFTRFVEPEKFASHQTTDAPDWQLRWQFFEELKSLYEIGYKPERAGSGSAAADRPVPLPIRFVISMRSEYISKLDPLGRFVTDLTSSGYHLDLLEKDAAQSAIEEPATFFDIHYEERCYENLIDDLVKEERFVEPAHLQIVCDRLWSIQGRTRADGAEPESESHSIGEIEFVTYKRLGGVKGILQSFMDECLNDIERRSPDLLIEALEILEPLITSGGTRNIVEKERLVEPPFRDKGHREMLLLEMVDRTILRIERRLGSEFVEITHEFLIPSILDACQKRLYHNSEYNSFRIGLRAIERYALGAPSGIDDVLSEQDFVSLHRNAGRIAWSEKTVLLMLRSAIRRNVERSQLHYWIDRYEESGDTEALVPVEGRLSRIAADLRPLLDWVELRDLNQSRDIVILDDEQLEQAFRSVLSAARAEDRADVRYWTKRVHS
jgi:hypothetical protein